MVSSGRVVDNGCHHNIIRYDIVADGISAACLSDGASDRCLRLIGTDRIWAVRLNCRGRLAGNLVINGGPSVPNGVFGDGGFQEMGTVLTSSDGVAWTAKVSWARNQTTCPTDNYDHGISHNYESETMTVRVEGRQTIRTVSVVDTTQCCHLNLSRES